ncbi:hypothetical protein [Bradyrhizobium sp. DOA9]|uniref:hypothetical protein n=1 Tax=Bradyrhizobium sp. DOA9 TaxID=1126627 RepID=UPI0004693330|nr:hypothetical protein [Bradyrhizobium sp. DOA9]GAJ31427.1 hypothetical protein BDOA9_0106060 [Bradyrhizobium sp. DOA9]
MARLYDTLLPLVQTLNEYGGNFTAHHISLPVLDAIDDGADQDASLADIRGKLRAAMTAWKGLQDHKNFSMLFETYYEAVFYLVAQMRGVRLRSIQAGADKGKTPDFRTEAEPVVGFEVKTIDVADPKATYDQTMEEGLEAKLRAHELARQHGVGIVAGSISPHGKAKDRLEVVEQIMKKIDGNVKTGQYEALPTFLVVSAVRSALHQRANDLRKAIPWPHQVQAASGQLFAVAAHLVGEPFYFFEEWGNEIKNLGRLERAGILRDHPSIAGIIFLNTEWNLTDHPNAIAEAFQLNGIWNSNWEPPLSVRPEAADAAKQTFEKLCHAWNDTDDTRSPMLPTNWDK